MSLFDLKAPSLSSILLGTKDSENTTYLLLLWSLIALCLDFLTHELVAAKYNNTKYDDNDIHNELLINL